MSQKSNSYNLSELQIKLSELIKCLHYANAFLNIKVSIMELQGDRMPTVKVGLKLSLCLIAIFTATSAFFSDKAYAANCSPGRTINIVAHEDDDLLFLNPDIQHDIQNGRCVRTIFVTAGDAGSGSNYWMSRENGMRAAYANSAGVSNSWNNTTISILGHQAYLSTLQGNQNISLLFLRLPDGGHHCDNNGQNCAEGWAADNYQTLRKLWQGTISTIETVDHVTTYAKQELINVLSTAMATYGADTIRTQDFIGGYGDISGGDGDHWDHHSVAYFAQKAQLSNILVPHSLTGYRGYTVEAYSPNVTGVDLTNKQNSFYVYNGYDGVDCTSSVNCTPLLSNYLQRQYTVSTSTTTSSWKYQTMEGDTGSLSGYNANVGNHPASVLFNGNNYTFYYDATAGRLRYGYSSIASNSWTFGTLEGGGVGTNNNVGINPTAVVYNNQIHVFYYDQTAGNLRHAWSSNGTSWNVNNHDGDLGSIGGWNADVGINSSSTVYGSSLQLFYYDATNGNLRHSWSNNGTNWSFENLDGDPGSISAYNANVGSNPSLTVYSNSLQLYYYDNSHGYLRHAWADSNGWHFETLDGAGGSDGRISANVGITSTPAVDSNGTLHVFYFDQTNGKLRHMWTSATLGWQAENLIGDENAIIRERINVGSMSGVVVNGTTLDLFTYDATNGNLIHISGNNGSWKEEHIDGMGATPAGAQGVNLGYSPNPILLGTSLHVFYYDQTNGNLRHAWL